MALTSHLDLIAFVTLKISAFSQMAEVVPRELLTHPMALLCLI